METLHDDLVRRFNQMLSGLKKEPCRKCGGKMMLDFDVKCGYFRNCLTCGSIEYINISLASLHTAPSPGISREGRHAVMAKTK